MNVSGLLYKGSFNMGSISNPTYIYQAPSNIYMALTSMYFSTIPGNLINFSVYVSTELLVPNPDEIIIQNQSIGGAVSTYILPNLELANGNNIFVTAAGTGIINIQIRGVSQVIVPSFLIH